MKTLVKTLLATFVAGGMSTAFAASSVDLTVSGSIVPSACTPSLSNANINFGKIAAADLNQDADTQEPGGVRNSTLTINCDAPVAYGLRTIDNRAGTVGGTGGGDSRLGLGLTPSGERIGAHYIQATAGGALLDGNPGHYTRQLSSGNWMASGAVTPTFSSTNLIGFNDRQNTLTGPSMVKDATISLRHHMVFVPAKNLTLTEDVALDGHVTIEVAYL